MGIHQFQDLSPSLNDSGFILIIVMLFLSMLSLFVLCMLEANLLENKTSVFFQNKVKSFYLAEKYLLQAEEEIRAGGVPASDNVTFNLTNSNIYGKLCEVRFYSLTSTANYHESKSVLRSIFVYVGDTSDCDFEPNIITGRQSFWIEDLG